MWITVGYGDALVQLLQMPPYLHVSCYLVREEDGFTLIDTATPGSAPGIVAAAHALGGPIRRIALTHGHRNHAGLLDALHALIPDAEVLVSAREARIMRGDRRPYPNEPQVNLRGRWCVCTTPPARMLAPGDRVGSLHVIAAPGHTPGHIAFLDARDGTLIAGDALQSRGDLTVAGTRRALFLFRTGATWHPPTALESAYALQALMPTRLALGNGPVLDRPKKAMARAIALAECHERSGPRPRAWQRMA